jgi:hypothetical protein
MAETIDLVVEWIIASRGINTMQRIGFGMAGVKNGSRQQQIKKLYSTLRVRKIELRFVCNGLRL